MGTIKWTAAYVSAPGTMVAMVFGAIVGRAQDVNVYVLAVANGIIYSGVAYGLLKLGAKR